LHASARIDAAALRREHSTADIVASYGIELRRAGTALVGRCPFHQDGGRPNLHVYKSGRWICYRCGESGDVITFLQQIECLSFLDAAARLMRHGIPDRAPLARRNRRRAVGPIRRSTIALSDDEQSVLAAATYLYAGELLNNERALGYLAGRGFPRAVVERYQLGYSSGDELVAYLRWRRLPVSAAVDLGLIRKDGREFMAGRITVPEVRDRRPIWMIGRLLESRTGQASSDRPKYLGLPGRKPLLGWDEAATNRRAVFLVEGPLDLLALRMWGVPAVALGGSAAAHDTLTLLKTWDRVYLALDQDRAGREATERIANELGARAVRIELPPGVKDMAELAQSADGYKQFRHAVRHALTHGPDSAPLAA
jgi:DNA primase